MRVYFCDHHEVPLPDGHRFPMAKYRLLRESLVAEGILADDDLIAAPQIEIERIRAVHDATWVEAFLAGRLERRAVSRLGFPWSRALVGRTLASAGGTLAAARAALEDGIAGNLAGGTHHAFADAGAGYCVFNDLAVTARALLDDGLVERVLVFDVDVHQGDGTAAIFADEERVFTCSLHGARNYPLRKQASDLDVPLPDGTTDEDYLAALDGALDDALARARPDIVLYQGGVDGLAGDKLGRLALTHAGLAERDRRVFERVRASGLPIVLTLGGGYADPIELSLEAHRNTYRAARRYSS